MFVAPKKTVDYSILKNHEQTNCLYRTGPGSHWAYSQAVKVDVASPASMLFVSGQIALDLAPLGDIQAETQKVMENIGAILKAADLDYTNVVKASIFCQGHEQFCPYQ